MTIRIHIVAPYPSMLSIIEESLPLFPELDIRCSVGDLETGVQEAETAERQGADIIISRGGTARLIKQAVQVPVIDMQLSGYDMIRSLMLASNLNEKTAIVGFANITSGAQAIIDLLDLPLKAFTVTASEEVAPLLLDLRSRGYKQIAGDVITLKTANTYGLRGFLIQSGKESIVKALEDAKLIFGYLHRNDRLAQVFEQLVLDRHANLIVTDSGQQVIYEKLPAWESNPLSAEQLSLLYNEWPPDTSGPIVKKLTVGSTILRVEGNRYHIGDEPYTVYTLRTSEPELADQEGIVVRHITHNEPIADHSPVIRNVLERIRSLYRHHEPIFLQGEPGTGKAFLASHIHHEIAPEGMLLSIDLAQTGMEAVEELSLSMVSTVKLLHPGKVEEERLVRFARRCRERGVRLFLIDEQAPRLSLLRETDAAHLILPGLAERPEDIETLAHYFLSACHQRYGTTAVRLHAEALALLQQHRYPHHIDDLRQLVKQLALNERDYVIQTDTVRQIISVSDPSPAWHAPQGTLKEIEKQVIQAVLQEENYNQSRTADRLGINRATLWRKLKE